VTFLKILKSFSFPFSFFLFFFEFSKEKLFLNLKRIGAAVFETSKKNKKI